MRYWGKNIEIDGSYYQTQMAKNYLASPLNPLNPANTNPFVKANEGNAEEFEKVVQEILRMIEMSRVGKILIGAISQSPRKLRIIPLTLKEYESPGKDKKGNAIPGKRPCANLIGAGSFSGNDSVIWFEPWSNMPSLFYGGILPQQIMVHELQHSLRQMRGKIHPTPPLFGGLGVFETFPNAEELFSVTIENMYVSDIGMPQNMLGAYAQGSFGRAQSDKDFYRQYLTHLDVWGEQLQTVTLQLENLANIWNPFRIRRAFLNGSITL